MNLSTKTHVARKEHDCIWCREKIKPGERYIKDSLIFENEFQCNKYHLECDAAAKVWFKENAFEDGFEEHSFKRGTLEEA